MFREYGTKRFFRVFGNFFVLMRGECDRGDLSFAKAHDPDALRVAADLGDLFRADTNNYAVVGNEHNVVFGGDEFEIDELARLFVKDTRLDTLAATILQAVVVEIAALTVAERGYRDDLAAGFDNCHIDEAIVFVEFYAAHALRISTGRADVGFAKANALTLFGRDDEFVVSACELNSDKLVTFDDADSDLARFADVCKFGERRLLNEAAFCGEGDIPFRSLNGIIAATRSPSDN